MLNVCCPRTGSDLIGIAASALTDMFCLQITLLSGNSDKWPSLTREDYTPKRKYEQGRAFGKRAGRELWSETL